MTTKLLKLSIPITILCIWMILNIPGISNTALFHLYYLPIYLSAWLWGYRGGAAVGAVAFLLSGPFMMSTSGLLTTQNLANWLIRSVFFIGLGFFIGILFTALRKSQQRISEQNKIIRKQKVENEKVGTQIIKAIAQAIELRDYYTGGHCYRVARMAVQVGMRMGLTSQELIHLKWAGIVHDVGKIGIPEHILNKPGKLTPQEYEIMKSHAGLGAKILSSTRYSEQISLFVSQHHERMDGKGYPLGISGEQITLQARILAVCDVWDAITSKRSYRNAFSYEQAVEMMKEGRGTQFDPQVLDVFMQLIEKERVSETVRDLLKVSDL